MKIALIVMFLTIGLGIVSAQSPITGITNTVTCYANGIEQFTGTVLFPAATRSITTQDTAASCNLAAEGLIPPNGGQYMAVASSSMSISGNVLTVTVNSSSAAEFGPVSGQASSTTSGSATLSIGGTGTGYAIVSSNSSSYRGSGGLSQSVLNCQMSVPGAPYGVIASTSDDGIVWCQQAGSPTNPNVPVQLGSIASLSYAATTRNANASTGGGDASQAKDILTVTFYAADGTPVPISWVPDVQPLAFYPIAPCRVVDTRNSAGTFGGPSLAAGETRTYPFPKSSCNIPSSAAAYSINTAVVPIGSLRYLTIWPSDHERPIVSTLNSLDGRIKAIAAIVPASADNTAAINVYVTDPTNVILDVNGYFAPATPNNPNDSVVAGLMFHPVPPCRVEDTRQQGDGPLISNVTRSFTIAGTCGVPPYDSNDSPAAYSLNITALPRMPQLNFLTVFPAGGNIPLVSTINAPTGTVTANAAIVPSGEGGAISAFVTDTTDLMIDVNGYYSTIGSQSTTTGRWFIPITPRRILDTRISGGMFTGSISVPVTDAASVVPPDAQAYVLNATVVPSGSLGFLTLLPDEQSQPIVSTLNALDGWVTSNLAVVSAGSGSTFAAFASNNTDLIVDMSGYFR